MVEKTRASALKSFIASPPDPKLEPLQGALRPAARHYAKPFQPTPGRPRPGSHSGTNCDATPHYLIKSDRRFSLARPNVDLPDLEVGFVSAWNGRIVRIAPARQLARPNQPGREAEKFSPDLGFTFGFAPQI